LEGVVDFETIYIQYVLCSFQFSVFCQNRENKHVSMKTGLVDAKIFTHPAPYIMLNDYPIV